MSFQGLSDDVEAGSRSCERRAFQDNGLDEENARGTILLSVVLKCAKTDTEHRAASSQ